MSPDPKHVSIQPLISYPRQARPGETYLMTVDLRPIDPQAWPYAEEEYAVHCLVDTLPLFSNDPIGEPAVVLHRFGGTYGPARFLLTAAAEERKGTLRVTLCNAWGVPVQVLDLPEVRVTRQAPPVPGGRVTLIQTGQTGPAPPALEPPVADSPRPSRKETDLDAWHNPLTVRLVISGYGERYRVELLTAELGDTEGDMISLPGELEEWLSFLLTGGQVPATSAEGIGAQLFRLLLRGSNNFPKWAEILARAQQERRPILLLIDVNDALPEEQGGDRDWESLPFGLLYDPDTDDFLFRPRRARPAVHFARILRRAPPRGVRLANPVRVLLAASEPADMAFDCARLLLTLAQKLLGTVELLVCSADGVRPLQAVVPGPVADWRPEQLEPLCRVTRADLRRALEAGPYDVLHLFTHHVRGELLVAGREGQPDRLTGTELADWCGTARLPVAFLHMCQGSRTQERSRFSGLAQRLLNPGGGNLAAVVASSFPLNAQESTEAAIAFYRRLARGVPLVAALDRGQELPLENWSWALLELWVRSADVAGARVAATSPYRGLAPFGERDADLFFGRDAEVADLLSRLADETVLLLVGGSGSGKTSLLRAGLTPSVRLNRMGWRPGWQIIYFRPGEHPAPSLLAALNQGPRPSQPIGNRSEVLQEQLDRVCRPDRPLLLLCDQLEELFTLCQDGGERLSFVRALAEFAYRHADDFRLVLALRSDYLGATAALSSALPGAAELFRRPWVLGPPGPEALRAIISSPAEYCGYQFESGLLDRLFHDTLYAPEPGLEYPLPFLEFGLERLWLQATGRERDAHVFTHADYDQIGGLDGVITRHAEEVYQSLGTRLGVQAQAIAGKIFAGLVGAQGAGRPRQRLNLEAETGNAGLARQVIGQLVNERLLRTHGDPADPGRALVEIAHAVLIVQWGRLKAWLALDSESHRLREAFEADARRWLDGFPGFAPRSREGLPNRTLARQYLAWIDRTEPVLSEEQRAFAEALHSLVRPWWRWLWPPSWGRRRPSDRPPS
jgi:hypothetical protein